MTASLLATVFTPLLALAPPYPLAADVDSAAEPVAAGDDVELSEAPDEDDLTYGPFFEEEAPSDVQFATQPRSDQLPVLSLGQGAFCFVQGTYCRASMILSASVGAGIRAPASDEGPDIPYAQFTFRGGLAIKPAMLRRGSRRKAWHPWGVGVVGSWSKGTGSLTIRGDSLDQEVKSTDETTVFRVGVLNQLWLSKRKQAVHLDFTLGGARSDVLTSGTKLWGTHAELAMGWGGWGALYLSGDFLDRDTRLVMGLRGHGLVTGPILAMALAGLAAGGAL